MPKFKPPKPTLTASPVLTVVEQRKAMFDGWIDECAAWQDEFNEWLLVLMPSQTGNG